MTIRDIVETSGMPSIELLELEQSGVLGEIFPELTALDISEISPTGRSYKNNFYHTLQVLDEVARVTGATNPVLRWAAVLHDIGKPRSKALDLETGTWTFKNHNLEGAKMVPGILRRQQVPSEWVSDIEQLVFLHMRPVVLIKEPVTESAVRRVITEAGPLLQDLLTLAEADVTSRNREKYLENIQILRRSITDVIRRDAWENLNPVLGGNWIMDNYQITDPSQIGQIKERIKDLIWNMKLPNLPIPVQEMIDRVATSLGIQRK